MRRTLVIVVGIVVLAGGVSGRYADLGPERPALAEVAGVAVEARPPVDVVLRFDHTGGDQYVAVPADVTTLDVSLCGASGGDAVTLMGIGPGGRGARVDGTVAVTPRSIVTVRVGGRGQGAAGGWNGGGDGGELGGGGGGATDIRVDGDELRHRAMVAGGGGGGGAVLDPDGVIHLPAGGDGGATGGGGGELGALGLRSASGGRDGDGGQGTLGGQRGRRGRGGDAAAAGGSGGGGGLFGGGGSGARMPTVIGAGGGGSSLGETIVDGACEGDGWAEIRYTTRRPPTIRPHGVHVLSEGSNGIRTWRVPVILTAPAEQPVRAEWTATSAVGVGFAAPGRDFEFGSGTVEWAPGETQASVEISVMADQIPEPSLYGGEWGVVRFDEIVNAELDTETFFGLGLFVIADDD